MLNNSLIKINNLEMLPPLFSTIEASGVANMVHGGNFEQIT